MEKINKNKNLFLLMKKQCYCLYILIFVSVMIVQNIYAGSIGPSSDLLLLVDKDHKVDIRYAPQKTRNIANLVKSCKKEIILREDAADEAIRMFDDMKKEGIADVQAVSGHRTYAYQTRLFNNEINRKKNIGHKYDTAYGLASQEVAVPGASEHQLGLAIDLSTQNSGLTEQFAATAAGMWLDKNSYKYGFILRYKKEKSHITKIVWEPWHFRYVGKIHARIMYEKDLCLEEYLDLLKNEKVIKSMQEGNTCYQIFYTTDIYKTYENTIDRSYDHQDGYIVTTFLVVEDKNMPPSYIRRFIKMK